MNETSTQSEDPPDEVLLGIALIGIGLMIGVSLTVTFGAIFPILTEAVNNPLHRGVLFGIFTMSFIMMIIGAVVHYVINIRIQRSNSEKEDTRED